MVGYTVVCGRLSLGFPQNIASHPTLGWILGCILVGSGLLLSLTRNPTFPQAGLPVCPAVSLPLLTAPAQTTAIEEPRFQFSFPPHLCRLLKSFNFSTGVGPDTDIVTLSVLSPSLPQPSFFALLATRAWPLIRCLTVHASALDPSIAPPVLQIKPHILNMTFQPLTTGLLPAYLTSLTSPF